jgi:hypothetical protein
MNQTAKLSQQVGLPKRQSSKQTNRTEHLQLYRGLLVFRSSDGVDERIVVVSGQLRVLRLDVHDHWVVVQ